MPAAAHLRLLPVTARDEARLSELLGLPEVCRYLCDDVRLPSCDVAGMIGESLDAASIARLWRLAASENDCVGVIGLRPPSQASLALRAIGWRSLELEVALDPKFWGRGLATEAIEAVARLAEQDGVTFALVAPVIEANQRAHRLMRRCGFHELGRSAASGRPSMIYERAL